MTKQVVLTAVQSSGRSLYFAPGELQRDVAIALAACAQCGACLRLCETFQSDKQVVLAAVRSDPQALRFAAEELREDPDVQAAAARAPG